MGFNGSILQIGLPIRGCTSVNTRFLFGVVTIRMSSDVIPMCTKKVK